MQKQYNRERLEELLNSAKESQLQFWDHLAALENELDCEIDGETLSTSDVDSLIAMAEGDETVSD
jgi:hypothetical protein